MFKSLKDRLPKLFSSEKVHNATQNVTKHAQSNRIEALPKFQTIGDPSNILSIEFPQYSKLNYLSKNLNPSLIGINGAVSKVNLNNDYNNGLSYQQIFNNEEAMNLILDGENYKYLSADQWTIFNDEHLLGWTEDKDVVVKKISYFENYNSVKVENGSVLISGTEEIVQFDVSQDEEMVINSSSLIATTIQNFQYIPMFKNSFSTFRIPYYLKISKYLTTINEKIKGYAQEVTKSINLSYWRQFKSQFVKYKDHLLVGRFIKTQPIFIKVRGPGKVVIGNSTDKLKFTTNEINHIFK